jgi:hypothetical protein
MITRTMSAECSTFVRTVATRGKKMPGVIAVGEDETIAGRAAVGA